MSSALPCGMPSTTSIIVTSQMSRCASTCAQVAPTLPAPKTVTFAMVTPVGALRETANREGRSLATPGTRALRSLGRDDFGGGRGDFRHRGRRGRALHGREVPVDALGAVERLLRESEELLLRQAALLDRRAEAADGGRDLGVH